MNVSLIAAMQNVRSNTATKSDFAAAFSELSEQIALIFPGQSRRPSASPGRRVSGAGTNNRQGGGGRGRSSGRGGCSLGRGYGRGCGRGYGGFRGRGGPAMADGVNISDVTRSFSDQEWASLSSENRRHVHKERERRRKSEGPAREISAATAATAVTGGSSVTFEKSLWPSRWLW